MFRCKKTIIWENYVICIFNVLKDLWWWRIKKWPEEVYRLSKTVPFNIELINNREEVVAQRKCKLCGLWMMVWRSHVVSSRNIWTGRLTVLIMMMIEMRKESRNFFVGVFFYSNVFWYGWCNYYVCALVFQELLFLDFRSRWQMCVLLKTFFGDDDDEEL